ncbi:hypothetical protein C1637_07095 [Chryseobacterium lactis]|uniref:DUF1634 domain-containing protein n=4 Tax=Chryseobacterium TaxID=59732 RepID=A0A3G6RJI0_CHRLC|nr:hypothetical protein [Sphingobacterium multivorum]AZA84597.1 hypothetical protein EG342_23065 [Chryseobacterium lactis]KMQ64457.1 hypothetical protein ACM46_09285 [Chryseobacterium angstadtii]SFI55190.1 hypothetical protein SAMN05421692_0076 [Chryseobacterium indologenes]SHG56122.1 hypothetical protein SAMN05421866_0831 [Chryseobacterium oranimense]AZB04985.1 hypothetical protein EG341_13945 [Chryseobacterium lactis]
MKALKVLYALSFMVCLLQLVLWLFTPFMGVGAIWHMVTGSGFYSDAYPERISEISEKLGMTVTTFKMVNQIVSIIYFITLIIPVLSIFFLKKFSKRSIYITVNCLFVLNILILFSLWLQKFL